MNDCAIFELNRDSFVCTLHEKPDELHDAGLIVNVNWVRRFDVVVDSGS